VDQPCKPRHAAGDFAASLPPGGGASSDFVAGAGEIDYLSSRINSAKKSSPTIALGLSQAQSPLANAIFGVLDDMPKSLARLEPSMHNKSELESYVGSQSSPDCESVVKDAIKTPIKTDDSNRDSSKIAPPILGKRTRNASKP